MNQKPPIVARSILRAVQQIRRQGVWRAMNALEREHPDLAEHLLEELTLIQRRVLDLGGPAKPSRAVNEQIETLTIVMLQTVLGAAPSPSIVTASPRTTHKHPRSAKT